MGKFGLAALKLQTEKRKHTTLLHCLGSIHTVAKYQIIHRTRDKQIPRQIMLIMGLLLFKSLSSYEIILVLKGMTTADVVVCSVNKFHWNVLF